MDSDRSVTEWLQEIQQGVEGEPQEQLLDHFLRRLTALARKRLGSLRTYEDEDDVALSAMKSFFLRAPDGAFGELTDRNSLWSLLAAITINKTISLQRRQLSQKRDPRRVESLDLLLSAEPTDQLVDSVISEGNHLLESLPDQSLRDVARLRMEGYSNQEIADRIERSVKSVERKLQLIRKTLAGHWRRKNDGGEGGAE